MKFLILFFAVFLATVTLDAQTKKKYYVKQGATGSGVSWTDASGNLQTRIDLSNAGDTIFVAKGTYTGGFFMKEGVQVYGGFAGNESSTSQRTDPMGVNKTTLNGGGERRVLTQAKDFNIVTVWDGFVIQQGKALCGAGAFLLKNSALRNCEVVNNTAGTPYIGEYVHEQGGIVFYVDNENNKAYIISMKYAGGNNALYSLKDGISSRLNTLGFRILPDCNTFLHTDILGSGAANTALLVKQGSAAAIAAQTYLNPAGFTNPSSGWYLPSASEWSLFVTGCGTSSGSKTALFETVNNALLAYNGDPLDGTSSTYHWSSTPYWWASDGTNQISSAWRTYFGDGKISYTGIFGLSKVRTMSAFYLLNPSVSMGGGIYAGVGAQVQGCLVQNNSAPTAAGVYLTGESTGMINCTVVNNTQTTARKPQYKPGDVYPKGATGSAVKGVVFYTDLGGAHGWMVALKDASTATSWREGTGISSVTSVTTANEAVTDVAGYINTKAIRTALSAQTNCAALKIVASDFNIGWYLPAAGQLNKLCAALNEVNATLSALGSSAATMSGSYWSSTQSSNSGAWSVDIGSFNIYDYDGVSSSKKVRAVCSF